MRKRTKIFIKLTSFMLALVTLFCILPLTAFADEPSGNATSVNSEEVSADEHYGFTNELVTGYTSTVGSSTKAYSYEYDSRSNITSVSINGTEKFRYVYDDLNQLIREDNVDKNATFVYNYDTSGNITSVKKYSLTAEGVTPSGGYMLTSYGYSSDGWGDKLTSFNGQAISYDSIGNPLTYYNGSSYSFTWQGRQLVGATKGNKTMSFEYNADGIRTSKTVNGVETKYYLNGSQIVAEANPNYSIMYIYDADGSPIGMQYRASSYAENVFDYYFFEKNLQGDIVAVYGSNGTKYVEYSYDAWGNFTTTYYNGGASTGAAKNPFTYRGYYYDADLNLYYLNSRYYDSNVRRFISPDAVDVLSVTPMSLTDKNLYAYCDNNPITRVDNGGEFWHIIAGAVVGAVVGAVKSVVKQVKTGGEINWGSVLVSAGAGAVSGAAASTGIGAVGQVAINSFASATESYLTQGIENGFSNIDYGEVVVSAIEGGVSAIGNGQTKGNAKHLLTQGNTATKQLKQKGLVKTAKYYWSQTKNIFYKPLMKKTFSLQATAKWVLYNDAKYFAEQLLQR